MTPEESAVAKSTGMQEEQDLSVPRCIVVQGPELKEKDTEK